MKFIGTRLIIAVWLAFMIATVGPVFVPDLATTTAPLTCPGGHINVQIDVYRPRPGETDTTFTPLCTTASGKVVEVPVLLSMVIIWAFALLPAWLLMMLIPSSAFSFLSSSSRSSRAARSSTEDRETLARLNELKQAHDAGLITQEEYDAKRKEIVKGM